MLKAGHTENPLPAPLFQSSLSVAIAGIILAASLTFVFFQWSFERLAQRASDLGLLRLEQSIDRMMTQIDGNVILMSTLSDHPLVLRAMTEHSDSNDVNEFLLTKALQTGVEDILLLNMMGRVTNSSRYREEISFLGRNFARDTHVRAAMTGRNGLSLGIDPDTLRRQFRFSTLIRATDGTPRGVLVLNTNAQNLEFSWRVETDVYTFTTPQGVNFFSNRTSLALTHDPKLAEPGQSPAEETRPALKPFPEYTISQSVGFDIWNIYDAALLPARALVVESNAQVLGLTGRIFVDLSSVMRPVLTQAALVFVVLSSALLIGLFIRARNRQVQEMLQIEVRANQMLEERVALRTRDLEATQGQLVQASKMSALGELSAEIGHELNQPLASIMNFAENGTKLLTRQKFDAASENFEVIADQADRVSRILKSLRSFARKEDAEIQTIDLRDVIEQGLMVARQRMKASQAELHLPDMPKPLWVRAGDVRMQQVFVNLLTNALDAVAGQPRPELTLAVVRRPGTLSLIMRDNGPGLESPTQVFEPFYSTKSKGASKGLGLGLSIAYGIVGSFGGSLSCRNHPDGGAEFKVTLSTPNEETAK